MLSKQREVRRVLWVTLVLNLLVAVAKLSYGTATGVLSMAADGIHSLIDGANNVVGLIAVSAASAPPDQDHPYGHRKFETFAALAIGGLLLLACWEIVKSAASRFSDPREVDAGAWGLVVMGVTMAVNLFVAWYEDREGRRLRSEILQADAVHTRSDVLVSLSVIAALVAAMAGITWVDAIATIVIVGWILALAWRVARPAVAVLADESRLDPRKLDDAAMEVEGVRDVHRIRTRGHLDAVFVDMHLQVDRDATIEAAHDVAHQVEAAIRARFPSVIDVTIHLEPHGDLVEGLDGRIVGPPR